MIALPAVHPALILLIGIALGFVLGWLTFADDEDWDL